MLIIRFHDKIKIIVLGNSEVNFSSIVWSHVDNSCRTLFSTSHDNNLPLPVPSNGSVERKVGVILTEDQKAFFLVLESPVRSG
jgi:hypothetical protein